MSFGTAIGRRWSLVNARLAGMTVRRSMTGVASYVDDHDGRIRPREGRDRAALADAAESFPRYEHQTGQTAHVRIGLIQQPNNLG